ncbi:MULTISPECIES: hypothetical protein [unclassified Flavobacterium]|uniref:hypothetical protein n=1 Tax=unclassified Flavobacterium TaxID=196869 RepID=UPI00057E929A|nr:MULTISPECIES: hypothetical protein [unclassified Flavobacterium]KIA94982.1 hypothetical protein OA93_18690 [Flavobacterium sp. KMS]OUL61512.1 hypothetical protein B8T70_14985 [Flavobacterium sp. AJR]
MKTINKTILLLLVILMYSCDDILEKDISDDTIQINSPASETIIESNVVNFVWNNIKGADTYRIQIFESNQILLLDSLTTRTNITLPLKSGNYIWRVRAENFAYESIYSFPSPFSTIIPDDLTNQQVILLSPENNKFINFVNVPLSWESLDNATSYSIKLLNTVTNQVIYSKDDLTETSITIDVPNLVDGNYQWRVKAQNLDTETKQYSTRKFSIDTTPPNQPKNIEPKDNASLTASSTINFSWSIAADTGNEKSPISYVIEFSNDADFTTIIETKNSSSTTFQETFSNNAQYYWRVKAIDTAGNIGINSTSFKFSLN